MIGMITRLFPVWAILLSVTAFFAPGLFAGGKPAIIPLLAVVMFGMGMTLKWEHFREVVREPRVILIGVLLQFLIMPLSAFVISSVLGLTVAFTAGMVLVGSSPGGTASNVITFLAGGNVALSITLTMTSTLIAVVMTPLLTLLYLHQMVAVPFWSMLWSVFQIVFVPVVAGTTINTLFGKKLESIRSVFPLISTVAIVLIIAIIVAMNQSKLAGIGLMLVAAVLLHNASGLLFGYSIPKWLGYDEQTCRTLSIEVGMQNSGLGVALAVKYFSAAAALPGAIFSIWHNLSGSLLAGHWNARPVEEQGGGETAFRPQTEEKG